MATGVDGIYAGVDEIDQVQYTQQFAYNGSGLVEYQGEAKPGTATSAAGWRIRKLTYSGSNVTKIEWAGGATNFNQVWDDRASLSYS